MYNKLVYNKQIDFQRGLDNTIGGNGVFQAALDCKTRHTEASFLFNASPTEGGCLNPFRTHQLLYTNVDIKIEILFQQKVLRLSPQ